MVRPAGAARKSPAQSLWGARFRRWDLVAPAPRLINPGHRPRLFLIVLTPAWSGGLRRRTTGRGPTRHWRRASRTGDSRRHTPVDGGKPATSSGFPHPGASRGGGTMPGRAKSRGETVITFITLTTASRGAAPENVQGPLRGVRRSAGHGVGRRAGRASALRPAGAGPKRPAVICRERPGNHPPRRLDDAPRRGSTHHGTAHPSVRPVSVSVQKRPAGASAPRRPPGERETPRARL